LLTGDPTAVIGGSVDKTNCSYALYKDIASAFVNWDSKTPDDEIFDPRTRQQGPRRVRQLALSKTPRFNHPQNRRLKFQRIPPDEGLVGVGHDVVDHIDLPVRKLHPAGVARVAFLVLVVVDGENLFIARFFAKTIHVRRASSETAFR
jgi:hypothetical protein